MRSPFLMTKMKFYMQKTIKFIYFGNFTFSQLILRFSWWRSGPKRTIYTRPDEWKMFAHPSLFEKWGSGYNHLFMKTQYFVRPPLLSMMACMTFGCVLMSFCQRFFFIWMIHMNNYHEKRNINCEKVKLPKYINFIVFCM